MRTGFALPFLSSLRIAEKVSGSRRAWLQTSHAEFAVMENEHWLHELAEDESPSQWAGLGSGVDNLGPFADEMPTLMVSREGLDRRDSATTARSFG